MSDDKVFNDNPVWISEIHQQAWLESLERMPDEDRKKWLEGEWKPSSPEEHEPHCNLLHSLAECVCDCKLSRYKFEHSILNTPTIT